MNKHLLCILSIIMATVVLIGCGGGGGGSKGGNDLNKLISTASKTVSGDTNTEIGDLSANGISLNLAKNSVEAGGKVTINQYSNIAAAARLSQQYPALASFTAISSLYDMSATDKNGKKVSTLNNPSELSIAISEDISSEKLYFAAIKQKDNWDLTPLSTSTNASYRAAVSQSKTVKITVNTVFDSLFIVAAPKTNIPSKLTYAEAFYFSVNGSTTTPQTIAASYIQKFDDDIEVNIRLTLKGELTPDKADMTLTAIQNGNKTIGIRKTDKSYKDMTFTSTDETGKYKGSVKLDSSLATISMAGDTATYTFYIKAKDIAVSDMPSTLILRASITGSKPFYSSDMQINFAKGPDRVANNVKMTTPSTTSDVAANTTVVLNFDQPVKIDSGKEAVLIPVTTGGNTVKADYSFSNSNKTLTIKFTETLAFNTQYTVSIKSGIQSENMKYKDVTPIDFVFTTGARRYTITFDGNGNTSGSVPMEKDSFLSKATYTLPTTTDLVKTGYKISCWNTKADGTGTDYSLGSTITFATSDIVLYAKWAKNPTYVNGIISKDTTWTLANSPYELTDKVQIDENVTLTIEPGVVVKGNNNELQAFGILKAIGNKNNRIVFNDVNILIKNPNYGNNCCYIDLEFAYIKGGQLTTNTPGYGYWIIRDSILKLSEDFMYIWYPSASCYIERNIFDDCGHISIGTSDGHNVYVRNNLFTTGTNYRVGRIENWACYNSYFGNTTECIVEKNTFIEAGKCYVSVPLGYTDTKLSALNNYWGTQDESVIKNMIFDKNDDLEAYTYIEYKPFLTSPDPDTPTLADLK